MQKGFELRKFFSLAFRLVGMVILFSFFSGSSGLIKPASASPQMLAARKQRKVVVFHPPDGYPPVRLLAPAAIQAGRAPQLSSFNIQWIGAWPADARNAFGYAVSIWEAVLDSSVPIQVIAEWDTQLQASILGWSQAVDLQANFSGAPVLNTWYQNALANKLAGTDLRPDQADIEIGMNSRFPYWYFGTDGNPSSTQADFASVVVHELAHGLGFYGTMEVDDGSGYYCSVPFFGCWGLPAQESVFPSIFDQLTEDLSSGSAVSLVQFASPSEALAAALTGGAVYFNGYNAVNANNGQLPMLYAPGTWEYGSSFSHLDDAAYSHTENGLMTPALGPGEVTHNPGPIVCGVFADLGWGVHCTTPVPASTSLYLPIISRGGTVVTGGGIHGSVTLNGSPASGVSLSLLVYDPVSSWTVRQTMTTEGNGGYNFVNLPALTAGQKYLVQYQNSDQLSGRLWMWETQSLTEYAVGQDVQLPTFDITDFVLSLPDPGAALTFPITFTWNTRQPGESYELNVYGDNYRPWWYSSATQDANSFVLTGLPQDPNTQEMFQYNVLYNWVVWVYGEQNSGHGIPLNFRSISFLPPPTGQSLPVRTGASPVGVLAVQRLHAARPGLR